MYFRLSQDVKILFLTFFQKLFALYEEGKISFVDGRNKLVFASSPKVYEIDTYDFKTYPAILVGISNSSSRDASFNKYRGYDSSTASYIYGAIANLTLTFTIFALTKEDRNQLADLVYIYLLKQETKQTFEQQKGIRFQTPSLSGDGVEDDVQTNVKRFFTTITFPVEVDMEDITQVVDSMGRPGLTVLDILSLIGDQGNGEIGNLDGE